MPRKFEPSIELPPSDVTRWAYVARFSAYQDQARLSLAFFNENASRRSRSQLLLLPDPIPFPEKLSDVSGALLNGILDWEDMIHARPGYRRSRR